MSDEGLEEIKVALTKLCPLRFNRLPDSRNCIADKCAWWVTITTSLGQSFQRCSIIQAVDQNPVRVDLWGLDSAEEKEEK